MCQVGRPVQVIVNEGFAPMRQICGTEICRRMTPRLRTLVSLRHVPQLAILRARKVLDDAESVSIEIDQPLYCRRSSLTDSPRLPRMIVPTR